MTSVARQSQAPPMLMVCAQETLCKPVTLSLYTWLAMLSLLGMATCDQHQGTEHRLHRKYLSIKCDWSISGSGCYLRESYCSHNMCICKPDHPINIADRMCVARFKNIDEQCSYSQECKPHSFCATIENERVCQCKTGYVYSSKLGSCTNESLGSACKSDLDCAKTNLFCDPTSNTCQCSYGYQWDQSEETCYKRSKYGEACQLAINCVLHDEFSDCDPSSKICICGQFLSRKYALDEVTNRCIACPLDRYHNTTNTCGPEKMTVSYVQNKRQYIYIIFCMSPFVVVIIIGFIYGYFNPAAASGFHSENIASSSVFYIDPAHFARMTIQTNILMDYCLRHDAGTASDTLTSRLNVDHTPLNLCGVTSSDPPPAYETESSTSLEMPPPYDEAIQQND